MKRLYTNIIVASTMIFAGCTDSTDIDIYGSINGIVMDEFVQTPVTGASVAISPLGKTIITGSDGAFEFTGLEAQTYTVSVTKDSYSSDSKSITVQPGVAAEANFSINTENGAVQISKSELDFGLTNITLAFDITNIGISTLFYSIACDSYDWLTVSPASGQIIGSSTQPITVTIDRDKISEDKSITLPITSNMGSDEVQIIVDIDENAPVMELSKSELDFGETETTLYFQVKNTGKSDLTFEISENKDWLEITSSSNTVSAGGYEIVTAIANRDLLKQSESFDLLVTSNGGDDTIEISIDYYINSPVLSVSTETLDFGDTKSTIIFQIENTGTQDLIYEFTENIDWFSLSASSYTVTPSNSVFLTASIDRALITQSVSFELLITSNGGYEILTVSAKPYVPSPVLELSVDELDFGDSETTKYFKISNSGDAELTFAFTEDLSWLTLSTDSYDVSAGGEVMITATIDRELVTESAEKVIYITSNGGSKELVINVTKAITFDDVTIQSCDDDIEVIIRGVKASGTTYKLQLELTNNGDKIDSFYFGTEDLYTISTYAVDNTLKTYYLNASGTGAAWSSLSLDINNVYCDLGSEVIAFDGSGASVECMLTITNLSDDASYFDKIQIGVYGESSTTTSVSVSSSTSYMYTLSRMASTPTPTITTDDILVSTTPSTITFERNYITLKNVPIIRE